ncbi:hypothetical protein HY546_00430 [archaeon]|nr:hypothetical protein [archaeon]
MNNGLDGLEKLGWSVYPWMVVKENRMPYCKCIGSIKNGRVHRVYWAPTQPPKNLKSQFMRELKVYLDGHVEEKAIKTRRSRCE